MKFLIITGAPHEENVYFGPFDTYEDAMSFGVTTSHGDTDWWCTQLESPDSSPALEIICGTCGSNRDCDDCRKQESPRPKVVVDSELDDLIRSRSLPKQFTEDFSGLTE